MPTCQSNAEVKESRINFVFANEMFTQWIEGCWVDQYGVFPTHRPLMVEINLEKMSRQMRTLVTPTNYAVIFEEIVQAQVDEARSKLEEDSKAEPQQKENKGIDENDIRKANLKKLHHLMDQQLNKRQYRTKHAQSMRKTDQQWDMIAAAVEQAVIQFHELKDMEAK